MPSKSPVLGTIWLFVYSWAACVLAYMLGIVITTALVDTLSTSIATTAAFVLVAAEIFATCAAIVWVHARSATALQPLPRYVCVIAFAVLQLGTCAIAAITTLLALNR